MLLFSFLFFPLDSKDTELAKHLSMKFTILGICYFQRILRRHTVLIEIVSAFLFAATSDIICYNAAFLARTFNVSSLRNYLHIIGLLHKELAWS